MIRLGLGLVVHTSQCGQPSPNFYVILDMTPILFYL